MNRVTIFGDIHGNLPALEAVLADMDQRELSPLYCLGDLVGYGTFPNEVIELIRGRNIPTLMGNMIKESVTAVTTAAVRTQTK